LFVQNALDYFAKWQPTTGVMRVLVNCRAGRARSTALALVLLRFHRGPWTEKQCLVELLRVQPLAAPNIAIVQHGDELLGCGGELVRSVEGNPDVTRRRAEADRTRGPYAALVSLHLGKPDRARAQICEAISAAEASKEIVATGAALTFACSLYKELREPANVKEVAERLAKFGVERRAQDSSATASVYLGWAFAEMGRALEGIALIGEGAKSLTPREATSAFVLATLSEAQTRAGRVQEALATIEKTFPHARKSALSLTGTLWRRGEIHRHSDEAKAEADFREAIAVAKAIGSKLYELRATTSLARLLRDTNRRDEPRTMLADIYNWFTEGFDTADLKEAKALLEELSR
jgi:tetratricopeptide (TPR) repeat protein